MAGERNGGSWLKRYPSEKGWRWHGVALTLDAAASFLFLDHLTPLTKDILGGHDPSIMMWTFAWWSWSLTHHLSAVHTNLLWQPPGHRPGPDGVDDARGAFLKGQACRE